MTTKLTGHTLTIEATSPEDLRDIFLYSEEFWEIARGKLGFNQRILKRYESEAQFSGSIKITVELPIDDDDVPSDRETDLRENAVRGGA